LEKRLLFAAGLSLLVLLAWEWLVPKPAKPPQNPAVTPPAAVRPSPALSGTPNPDPSPSPSANPDAASAASAPKQEPAAASAEETVRIGNDLFTATFSNRGGVLTSFTLAKYSDDKKKPLDLVRALPPELPRPLALDFGRDAAVTKTVANALFVVERPSERTLRLRYADATVAVEKEIRISDDYLFELKVQVNGPAYDVLVGPGLRNPTEAERKSSYVMPASAVLATTDGLKLIRADKAEKVKDEIFTVPPRSWAGIEDNYFLEVLVPQRPVTARIFTYTAPRPDGKPSAEIATGLAADGTLEASAYFGPKDVSILEGYGLGLERTVDFGWYAILARPLLWLMKKSYAIVPNWGLAILVVTFIIRLLLFPLTAKSYISMKKMQKLAPKMNAIRDKYKKAKTDAAQRQKMNAELMALYQTEGYNPMSGCLPVLLQLPVLVAFYNVLSRTIELRHAPFVLWIKDLSAIDHTYVLVILMIGSMYAQQAMTPSTLDPTQKKIFMFMPVLWGFFLKDMPSGLVLYWLFSNLLTIVQQLVMNKIVKEDDPAPPAKGAKALKQARA
jgi:YidC/Oxa1 family membrane protein insertase